MKKIVDDVKSLAGKLRWLMFFRVVTTAFLLGTTVVVQYRDESGLANEGLVALYVLIGTVYFVTFLYALLLPKFFGHIQQAYIQIFGDVLINTVVIYLTGGLESAFSFMYILTIINAGVLLQIRGAVLVASLSAIVYGTLIDLHYYRYIEPYLTRFSYLVYYQAKDILTTLVVNMGAFYLVAILSGYLSKQAEESRIKLAVRQAELERLENLNENIIQSIESGLMTLGSAGEILSFNRAAERITGFAFDRVRARPYTAVFPDLVLPATMTERNKQSQVWDWIHKTSEGKELSLELGLYALRDSSGLAWGRLLVFEDKTRIRQMEEDVRRIERLALVGELAAGIAHEIRNPLASISGSFQMLEAEVESLDDRKRLLNIIKRELERLNHIINDFLMFARPRSGKPEPVDLSAAVEDNLRMFEHQVGPDKDIQLIKNISPSILVFFDRPHLEQIMWNLLRNASDAMPGGGKISVSVYRPDDYPDMGAVSVNDTGRGISPKDLPKIYDPFFTTKDGGCGLGLSIVYRTLESAGGRIEVISSEDGGTSFTVYIPIYDDAMESS